MSLVYPFGISPTAEDFGGIQALREEEKQGTGELF
jgi:hypothetical protein